MKSIYSGFVLIAFVLIIFTSIVIVGSEMDSNNLDTKSQQVLSVINNTIVEDIAIDNLNESSLINGTNPQDKQSFGFEFLSAQTSATKKISILEVIKNGPSILVASTGAPVNDFAPFINIAGWFIGILLSLIFFDAIFTRRVFNR